MFLFLVSVLTVIIIILFLPSIQELIYSFVLLGVRVYVSKSDGNDGASLDLP